VETIQKVGKIMGIVVLMTMMLFTFSPKNSEAPARRGDVVMCAVALGLFLL